MNKGDVRNEFVCCVCVCVWIGIYGDNMLLHLECDYEKNWCIVKFGT